MKVCEHIPAAEVLGPAGCVSEALPDYEVRPQQVDMARAVEEALARKKHIIAEAGTGVGKSFAYLVPCIAHSIQTKTPVVVSTNTISLQEQLFEKDLPFLEKALPHEFRYSLFKGRQNYICLRRLEKAIANERSLFDSSEEIKELHRIQKWARKTRDGTLAGFRKEPSAVVWSRVCSEHGSCPGKKCAHFAEDCFYQRARRRIYSANIVVVNHHLYFSDLSLRMEGGSILPNHTVVVLDEAHRLEEAAARHIGKEVANSKVKYFLDELYIPERGRGFLVIMEDTRSQRLTMAARDASEEFFSNVLDWRDHGTPKNGRLRSPGFVKNLLSPALMSVAASLAERAATVRDEEDQLELESYARRAVEMASQLNDIVEQGTENFVYWVEVSGKRWRRVSLNSAPIDISPILREHLFSKLDTAVLTSATLAVGRERSFEYVKSRVGLSPAGMTEDAAGSPTEAEATRMDDVLEACLDSPFDYQSQVVVYVPRNLPDPKEEREAYESRVAELVLKYVKKTEGRAFVLFTSYDLMRKVHEQVHSDLESAGIGVFKQGEGMPRGVMLEEFKEHPSAVIFGADSFWQGVDVPGEALQNVIITKLPFAVPDEPWVEARIEDIQKKGGNSFQDFSLPEAVIRFKQGFGRLIRRKTDRGIVVILDGRVFSKSYGRVFLESLPRCPVVRD